LGLITGAVLHVMPALEKAVVMRSQAERALRVARIELTESGDRIVGIRFPTDAEVLANLKAILREIEAAKNAATGGASTVFRDEPFTPICDKSKAWATTEKTTMRTFFTMTPKSVGQGTNGNKSLGSKRSASTLVSAEKSGTAKKQKKVQKTASIQSFFGKK
jgi:hypothetical protein